ncbi:MAG: PEP-CTERM sorting domain-containing protein, partial [Proteobacteria bacterium]|nr:PEP-CTERM sorting domain-containing protein [Pseudomonadota bacterium]
ALLALAMQPAQATLINDDYIGGDDHGYGDVIGAESIFGIDSMDVELVGNMLSVSINTNFAGEAGVYSWATDGGEGIGYGDLFLGSSWNPYGTAPYSEDNSSNGTTWALALSLDDRWNNTGGTGSLYSLAGDGSDVLLSDNFLDHGTFRNGQEIAVDADGKRALSSSDWDTTGGSINFLIDLTGTALEGSDTIALHWGMTCGNDTIEGEYAVPEPAMLGLLALGLVGIGFSQRNKSKV